MLVTGLKVVLKALNMDTKLYSLNSLRWGAYQAGTDHLDIKRHGHSPVAAAVALEMT